MNFRSYLLRLLSVFVLCSVLFLTLQCETVHASDYGISTLALDDEIEEGNVKASIDLFSGPHIGLSIVPEKTLSVPMQNMGSVGTSDFNNSNYFEYRIKFKSTNSNLLASKGNKLKLDLTNMVNYCNVNDIYFWFNPSSVHDVVVYIGDISGNYTQINASDFSVVNGSGIMVFNASITVDELPCDAYQIFFGLRSTGTNTYVGGADINGSNWLTYNCGFSQSGVTFTETEKDEKVGLLQTIIQYVKGVWDGITELPTKIWNLIKTGFQWIVDGLTNLGNMLLEGIKNLFVPTEEDITAMQTKWTTLLEDRFGALYQTIDIIDNYANAFTNSEKNTITFPEVTIPLGEADFEFGGYEVKVVPDGFNIIFDTLKVIVSILATFLFVNAMKNRLEKLVGGSSNI